MTPETGDDKTAGTRTRRRATIGLVAVAVLAVAAHLGLGGAVLTSAPWAGWAAGGLVAVVAAKIIAVVVLARLATRRGRTGHRAGGVGLRAHLTSLVRRPREKARSAPAVEASARVPTPKAERYARQLCAHARWKAPRVEWAPPNGVIEFPGGMGTCRLSATADHLLLVVTAADAAGLAAIRQILTGNLERFANRDGLTVEWN